MSEEVRALSVSCAPPGFLRRAEFQPRVPVGGRDSPRTWLPRDPFFLPRLSMPPSPEAVPSSPGAGLAGMFRAVGKKYNLPAGDRAREHLSLLERGEARLVITGHQPGFLTGPLYTIYKAVTTVAAAAHLESLTGARHIPVFWVASEDHDLDEARAVRFPLPDGKTAEYSLPHPADRRPLSAYPVDSAAEQVVASALESLQGRRFAGEARALAELYRGRDLAGGFAAMMASLFSSRGILIIEPETLRPLAAPIFRKCLVEPEELLARIEEGIREVKERGIQAQVSARFPLFLLSQGKRHHLQPEARDSSSGEGRFLLEGTGRSFRTGELLEILQAEPERFSSGVLLRPLVQNAILPNVMYIGGPAEIAYFAQLRPLFEWFGLPPPGIGLRMSATLIEGKVERTMRRLELWPPSAPGIRRWERARREEDLLPPLPDGPEPLLRALAAEIREKMRRALEDPRIPAADRRRLETSGDKIAGEIEKLGARATRVTRQSESENLQAAGRALRNVFPDGGLQERRWNILYYIAKYGREWIDELIQEIEQDPFHVEHRWVFFSAPERDEGGEK